MSASGNRLSDAWLDALRARVDLVALIDEYVPLKKAGAEFKACCPFHSENTPSFAVNPVKGFYHCFGCGAHGDAIGFLMAYRNAGFMEAATELAARVGLAMPEESMGASAAPPPPARPPVVEKAPKSPWAPVMPVPDNAPPPHVAHIKRGRPETVWDYRDADGRMLGRVYRFRTSDGGKEVLPHTYCANRETGALEWRWMAFAEPRPLYGLHRASGRRVLVVEGEKCADAAYAELGERFDVFTWQGGGKAYAKADWSPLAGREVVIWPDCDAQRDAHGLLLPQAQQAGMAAALGIAKILTKQGGTVAVLDIPQAGEKPSGWDVADAIAEGLTGEALAAWIDERARAVAGEPSTPRSAGAGRDWSSGLFRSDKGKLEDCRENVYLVLSRHPEWAGAIGFDEFANRVTKLRTLPTGGRAGEWTEKDDYDVGLWLAQECGLLVRAAGNIVSGVAMAALNNPFHPVMAWLDGLPPWDGVDRLDHWLVDCLGVEVRTEADSTYARLAGRYFLMGMVMRILKPGCMMQYMPILEGPQGGNKSAALRVLGGEWFAETPFRVGDKDAYLLLGGAWLYEIQEMDAFNRAESTAVKAFVTGQFDRYREPYARRVTNCPRQCVFAGNTNHYEYLKDPTGNRRFWPIRAGLLKIDLLAEWREQLFAEALHRCRAGERYWPTPEDERVYFYPQQEAREIVDPWISPLYDWLEDVERKLCEEFTSMEILAGAFGVERAKVDNNRGMATRLGNLMAKLGWSRQRRSTGSREYVYVRPRASTAVSESESESGIPI